MRTDGRGKIFLDCPNCTQLHQVRKDAKHLSKPSMRMHCRKCGCSWLPSPEDQQKIREAYGIESLEAKKPEKKNEDSGKEKQEEPRGRSLGDMIFGR